MLWYILTATQRGVYISVQGNGAPYTVCTGEVREQEVVGAVSVADGYTAVSCSYSKKSETYIRKRRLFCRCLKVVSVVIL